ncbi:MAG TPA: VWA domain-containing protein [Vicinamibacterales bacterium]
MSAALRLSFAAALMTLFASLPRAAERQQSNAQSATFKSSVEYVEVDAIVTTAQGQIVRDLALKDFEILEDGKRQELTTFALVDIPIERYDGVIGAVQAIEPDITTNAHPEGRVYVLVLDELHIAQGDAARAKAAAKLFIARLGANDLMAVVHTAGVDAASQEFTNSQSRLLAAVDKSVGRGLASATASRNESAFMTDGRDTGDHDDVERAAEAQTTLRVVRDVANWFATVHGRRKAILLMSGGIDYPMTLVGSADQPNRPTDVVRSASQEAIDAAMRSNVSIYGIDPGGLTAGDDVGINYFFAPGNQDLGPRASGRELRMNQDSLRQLSEETGGIAVVGRNDLGAAFDRIVADNSAYYVLAYRPPASKRDGKFHKISVRVDRPGLVTRARSGYLSPNGKPPATPALDSAGPSPVIRDALGSPLPVSGLSMRLSFTSFMDAPPNASVLITEDLRGSDLKLGSPGTLELSYAAVDAAGKVRAGSNDRLQLTALKSETKAQITESGLRVFNRMTLSPGRYTVRVAAHDQAGGAVGSVAYDLEVQDFHSMPFSMSGLALTSIATGRMVVAKADALMKDWLPAPPITERVFPQSDQLWFFAEIYDNAGETPHTVTIGTTVRSESGAVVYTMDTEHSSTEFTGPRGVFRHRGRVPLNDFPPGAYVLKLEARAHLGRDEIVSRQIPYTVTATKQ